MAMERPPVKRFGEEGFVEAYGAAWGFPDLLPEFFAQDGIYKEAASQVTCEGRSQLAHFMKVYSQFSPSSTVTFTTVQLSDHGFAAEWVWAGTSDGRLWLHGSESPQDGTPFSIPGVAVCSVDEEGRIASHVDYWDSQAMLRLWRGESAEAPRYAERGVSS